jgi:drug/metabolite transporter (DMT)-like permease
MTTATARNNLIGIASLCAGSLVFSMQDTVIKLISGDHAVTLALVVRAIVAFPILVILVWKNAGISSLDTPKWGFLCLRGAILLVAYTSYFMAFPALPLAEAVALYFMVPVFVTLMSGPLLGERVGLLAWAAVGVGLLGVAAILRPGMGLFNPAALLSLISAATYALAMVLTRKYSPHVPSSVITFYGNVTYFIIPFLAMAVITVFNIAPPGHPSLDFLMRQWAVPSWRDLGLMASCGVIAAFGSLFLSHAYRIGQNSVVTPFEYTGMIWAVVFGFVLFSEVPAWTTVIGMGLIALSGILAMQAGKTKSLEGSGRDDHL